MGTPSWAVGLDVRGLYYEGIVDDANTLLEKHKISTVTTYGIRRSRKNHQLSPNMTATCLVDETVGRENTTPNTQVLHTTIGYPAISR